MTLAKRRNYRCRRWLIGLCTLLALASTVRGQGAEGSGLAKGPFCGLYCVAYASQRLGLPISRSALQRFEYVSTAEGSTADDLVHAFHDNGIRAVILSGLTPAALQGTRQPVILHVKRDSSQAKFDHFVALITADSDSAVVLDPVSGPHKWSLVQLVAMWSGAAIVAEPQSTEVTKLRAASFRSVLLQSALYIAPGLLALGLLSRLRRPLGNLRAFCGLCASTAIIGGACVITRAGVWSDDALRLEVIVAAAGQWLSKIDLVGAHAALIRGATFIDARTRGDYSAGHIRGAINIPPAASAEARRLALTRLSHTRETIVYCKGVGCDFAGDLAVHLELDGFTNVRVFSGGWEAWHLGETSSRQGSGHD